jgi:hypothetical protein
MAAMSAELTRILQDSGIDSDGISYFQAKKILTVGTFALVAADKSELLDRVCEPFEKGWNDSVENHKLTFDPCVWQATVQAAWEDCRAARGAGQLAQLPVESQVGQPSAGLTSPPLTSSKAPTSLAPGVWTAQIRKWENSFVPARSFPQAQLIGAESVLARLFHERTVTQSYTILQLGEILQHRSFTATGTVNNLATKEKDKGLSIDWNLGCVTERHVPVWDPRSMMNILDACEAAKWAWIFCEYGTEQEIEPWTAYFTRLTRTRSDNLDMIKNLWNAANWRVAMAMRNGTTFAKATSEVLQDSHWLQEFTNTTHREQPPQTARSRSRNPTFTQATGKGRSKGGKNNRAPSRPTNGGKGKGKGGGQGKQSAAICRNFNQGRCDDQNCARRHVCSKCGYSNHNALQCWGSNTTSKGSNE